MHGDARPIAELMPRCGNEVFVDPLPGVEGADVGSHQAPCDVTFREGRPNEELEQAEALESLGLEMLLLFDTELHRYLVDHVGTGRGIAHPDAVDALGPVRPIGQVLPREVQCRVHVCGYAKDLGTHRHERLEHPLGELECLLVRDGQPHHAVPGVDVHQGIDVLGEDVHPAHLEVAQLRELIDDDADRIRSNSPPLLDVLEQALERPHHLESASIRVVLVPEVQQYHLSRAQDLVPVDSGLVPSEHGARARVELEHVQLGAEGAGDVVAGSWAELRVLLQEEPDRASTLGRRVRKVRQPSLPALWASQQVGGFRDLKTEPAQHDPGPSRDEIEGIEPEDGGRF